ncbi:zf-TFIIB domain-containing protein [Nocardioides sp. GXQ0305]|uniref:TFIIB-type zinc ribbon-containing protein n=1 Tax=Nocardioides sp. GXQ0305 TaxID=3423912 RepID=UPI003D7E7946
MKCPNDGTTLTMSERSGIEIDYCPDCRGVWLDRGELDKLIERSTDYAAAPEGRASSYERERDERQQHYQQRYADPQRYPQQQPYRKKRKESWLSDIFD